MAGDKPRSEERIRGIDAAVDDGHRDPTARARLPGRRQVEQSDPIVLAGERRRWLRGSAGHHAGNEGDRNTRDATHLHQRAPPTGSRQLALGSEVRLPTRDSLLHAAPDGPQQEIDERAERQQHGHDQRGDQAAPPRQIAPNSDVEQYGEMRQRNRDGGERWWHSSHHKEHGGHLAGRPAVSRAVNSKVWMQSSPTSLGTVPRVVVRDGLAQTRPLLVISAVEEALAG